MTYYLIDTGAYSRGHESIVDSWDKEPKQQEIADIVDQYIADQGATVGDYIGEIFHLVEVKESFEIGAKVILN